MSARAPRLILRTSLPSVVSLLVLAASVASAEPPAIKWIQGPSTVDLGSDLAQIKLGEGFVFAGAEDTRKLMESMGNIVDNTEVGLVSPQAKDQDWFVIFEFHDVGYVKDDEKDKIDKEALLKGIREGTEEANKIRKERGIPGLHVVGWYEEPHYDVTTHNLTWALLAKDDEGSEVVNYNQRLLGRSGYMSVTLVDAPGKLALSKPEVQKVLSGFTYKTGRSYAEFVKGDKIAKYGLTALVAGGAGAAAVKLGFFAALSKFFAKAGKVIVLAAVALVAGLRKFLGSLFGRKRQEQEREA